VAQQEGSIAIAEAIRPTDEAAVTSFTKCVTSLKEAGAKIDKAISACQKVTGIVAGTNVGIAGKAAKAASAGRPQVIFGGNRGYYNNYYSGTPTVIVPAYSSRTTTSDGKHVFRYYESTNRNAVGGISAKPRE
jgi:aspartate aminotransferase-like enzyme